MLLICGIRENSGGIEISSAKTLLDSGALPEICNGGGVCHGCGVGAPSALIKINALEI